MLAIAGVLKAVQLAGANLPAFLELFNQVKATFSETDQATLQNAYDLAMAKARSEHAATQAQD